LALSERKQGEKVAAGEPHTPTRAETARRAKALYGVGYFHLMALNVKETRTRVEESLHLWRGLGDKWWMAVALERPPAAITDGIGYTWGHETVLPRPARKGDGGRGRRQAVQPGDG
jgi:hypothetical protein